MSIVLATVLALSYIIIHHSDTGVPAYWLKIHLLAQADSIVLVFEDCMVIIIKKKKNTFYLDL